MFVWWLTFFFTLLIDLVRSFRGKKVQPGFFFFPTICTPCSIAARPPPKHFHSSSQLQNRFFFLSATGEISQQNKPESNDSLENMINFFFPSLSVVSYQGGRCTLYSTFYSHLKKKAQITSETTIQAVPERVVEPSFRTSTGSRGGVSKKETHPCDNTIRHDGKNTRSNRDEERAKVLLFFLH